MAGMGHNRPPAPVLYDALDVFAALRRACREAGGQKRWAEAHGLLPSNVNDVLMSRRAPTPVMLASLGFVRVERFTRLSILPPDETQKTKAGNA
jgi:hypothetical protein